jgi:sialidase-1
MQKKEEIIVYQNPEPLLVSKQGIFPGVSLLPNNDLLIIFSIGQAFDSSDQRAFVTKSKDNGRSWSTPKQLHNHIYDKNVETDTLKPLVLQNGNLIATGYAFIRPDPLTPIVDPITFDVLPLKNKISFSNDNGESWSIPNNFNVLNKPLEISGPCIQLSSGRILAACPPFHLGETGHSGWIIYSDDNGKTWDKLSDFFNTPTGEIAAWECRLCEIDNNGVAVIFWTYDNVKKINLNNHIVFSKDGGESFGEAIDTGVKAQASNLMWLGENTLLTIHSHRESPSGLIIRKVNIANSKFEVLTELDLFQDENMGSDSTNISKQFGSLKFGQPSLIQLPNKEILATCWCYENNQHIIKTFIVNI